MHVNTRYVTSTKAIASKPTFHIRPNVNPLQKQSSMQKVALNEQWIYPLLVIWWLGVHPWVTCSLDREFTPRINQSINQSIISIRQLIIRISWDYRSACVDCRNWWHDSVLPKQSIRCYLWISITFLYVISFHSPPCNMSFCNTPCTSLHTLPCNISFHNTPCTIISYPTPGNRRSFLC